MPATKEQQQRRGLRFVLPRLSAVMLFELSRVRRVIASVLLMLPLVTFTSGLEQILTLDHISIEVR